MNTRLFCTREKDYFPHKVPVELMDQTLLSCEIAKSLDFICI